MRRPAPIEERLTVVTEIGALPVKFARFALPFSSLTCVAPLASGPFEAIF